MYVRKNNRNNNSRFILFYFILYCNNVLLQYKMASISLPVNDYTYFDGTNTAYLNISNLSGNNTPSVIFTVNSEVDPYRGGTSGFGFFSTIFYVAGVNIWNPLPLTGSYSPGSDGIYITPLILSNMTGLPNSGIYYIGKELLLFLYSELTYVDYYGSHHTLPSQFTPPPSGTSLNSYGGLQLTQTFTVQPVGIPTGLSVTTLGETSIGLSWTAPTDNGGSAITGYEIFGGVSSVLTGSSLTTYTLTGLTTATSYTITVAAINGWCVIPGPTSGLPSASITARTYGIPFAPTGLSAEGGVDEISITFNASVDNGSPIINYYIQYRTPPTSGTWTTIIIPPPIPPQSPTVGYNIMGLLPTTTYEIQVAGLNAAGLGAYSASITQITDTTPNAPTSLTGVHGNTTVTLSWVAPSNTGGPGAFMTEYLIKIYTDPSTPTYYILNPIPSPLQYIYTGLTNGTTYYFSVAGLNNIPNPNPYPAPPPYDNQGTYSAIISSTPSTIPGAPTITSSLSCEHQGTTITWTAPIDTGGATITSYLIQYRITAPQGAWLPTIPYTTSGNTLYYKFTGLTNGIQYDFQVAAVNINGAGLYSAPFTSSPSFTPNAPTSITSTIITPTTIGLSWIAPTETGGNPVTGYYIQWLPVLSSGSIGCADPAPSSNSYNTTTGPNPTATTYTITGLTRATQYAVQIRSINCSGAGPLSNPIYYVITASVPPSNPTNVVASSCEINLNNSIKLSWNAPTDNGGSPITNYIIYYRTTSGIWFSYDTNSDSTTAIISCLIHNTSYDFKVAAVNNAGVGVFSDPPVTSTPLNPPDAPTNVSANTNINGQIVLSWTKSSQQPPLMIANYIIEYKINSFGGWLLYSDSVPPTPPPLPAPQIITQIISGNSNIANNVLYDFRISAINSCGAESKYSNIVSAMQYDNSIPTHEGGRFNLHCTGNITSFDNLDANMLRKAQVLQYPITGSLNFTNAQLWSMAAKNRLTRQKAWASQNQEISIPNITNMTNPIQPNVGLKQVGNVLTCWTTQPTVICNSSASSDVPGKSISLCFSVNAPFNNYRNQKTYLWGGTKWPVYFSK